MPSEIQIEIRESWCKGCAFCVAVCPHAVLVIDADKPVVDQVELCTGCELCVWICPDFAIKITKDTKANQSPSEH